MQATRKVDYRTDQLSLNLSDGFFVPKPENCAVQQKRTITFPKHISIPHFGAFQRQVNALFAPFGIVVEFSLSRQKRLQMTWHFPPEPASIAQPAHLPAKHSSNFAAHAMLSDDEVDAFANVVFAFAGQPQS